MARTSATISVGADTRQLERDIQSALSRDFRFKGLNEKAFTQPLGRITGAANEFQKSLDASNARVIAFGASAGLIFGVERAFSALVKSTIDVQKSLTDINVILNVSTNTLQKFGGELFSIAKDTAQSFDTVAQAATEFSRQGLGLEETLKRTRDALILTRLSGLDTVSAVEALTATINSFSEAALDSTTIINKLANVDAAFAVSSADLAEAIKRVGSSAQDVNVDFDELLAIVTSVQQTTARGGAVIGNSLKTIFTRIQRTSTLDALEQLGIRVRTLEGDTLPAIQILSNLATTFNTLGDAQRAQVAEQVGGVFQINILRAALADLGKEYSVYGNALKISSSSADEAIERNEALNQTLSALINRTFVNLTKVGADIGRVSFQPTFENILNLLNKGLEEIDVESKSTGGKIAKGILEGLGAFISGPGVVLATAVLGKLLLNLGKFAADSLQTVLNINTKAQERAQIQTKINQVLAQEPGLVQAVYNKQITVLDVENKILGIIRQQTAERQRAAALSATLAGGLSGRGVTTKGGSLSAKSQGFIPNFALSEIFGALNGGYSPGYIKRMNIPGEGSITYNSAEKVKKFPGFTQPAIMPPVESRAGKRYKDNFSSIYGFNPYASEGFIPNFKDFIIGGRRYSAAQIPSRIKQAGGENSEFAKAAYEAGYRKSTGGVIPESELEERKIISNIYKRINPAMLVPPDQFGGRGSLNYQLQNGKLLSLSYPIIPLSKGITSTKEQQYASQNKEQLLRENKVKVLQGAAEYINTLGLKPPAKIVQATELFNTIENNPKYRGAKGALGGFLGAAFEVGIGRALGVEAAGSEGGDFDVRGSTQIKKTQRWFPGFYNIADFKVSPSPDNRESMSAKIKKEISLIGGINLKRIRDQEKAVIAGATGLTAKKGALLDYRRNLGVSRAKGFIPNFAALNDAINRELMAGVSPDRVRIGKDRRLTSASNPLGLGVYNTKDEPLGLGQGIARYGSKAKSAGAADGFVPNFIAPLVAAGGVLTSARTLTALSFAIPILTQTIKNLNTGNATLNKSLDALSQTFSFAFAGSLFGKKAGIVTGLVGAAISLYSIIKENNESIDKLASQLEIEKDNLSEFSAAMGSYSSAVDKLNNATLSGSERARILNEQNESLVDVMRNTPQQFQSALKDAIESGDIAKITEEMARVQSALQTNASNTSGLIKALALTKDKTLSSQEAEDFSKILISLRNAGGISVAGQVRQDPQLLRDFKKAIEESSASGSLLLNNPKIFQAALDAAVEERFTKRDSKTGEIGFFVPPEERSPEEVKKVRKEEFDKLIIKKQEAAESRTRENIITATEKFLQTAGIPEQVITEFTKDLRGVPVDQLGITTELVIKKLEAMGYTVERSTETTKRRIQTEEDYIRAAKNYTLTLEEARDFFKSRVQNPLDVLFKQEFDFNEQLGKDILNPTGYNKVLNAVTQEQANLRLEYQKEVLRRERLNAQLANNEITQEEYDKQIEKTIISEDQYRKRLDALAEKRILQERKEGRIFAEDFRSGRQTAREDRILGGAAELRDFSDSFFDEFDYGAQELYRDVQLGAAETARTIKSEFGSAFLDFANGTATAGQAFNRFALNVLDKIQQIALEASINLAFGKLFGSTSNLFGFGGGGGGFGSLFGFNKGGLVKGYSSGGTVTGGSGTKDDVPAMLTNGEYVIKKSAVNKYGSEFLNMLNNQAIGKFQTGGELQTTFQNAYLYNDPFRPTGGGQAIDSRLSLQAITDENNPINRIRQEREVDLLNYIKYVDDINLQNAEAYQRYLEEQEEKLRAEAERLKMEQQRRREIQDAYNQAQRQRQQGNWMKFGLGLFGFGASFFKDGGYIKKYARGGLSEDNVPAMLMDGEYVMRKSAVNFYGKDFFNKLNNGRIRKFAEGGSVGGSLGENGNNQNYSTNNVNVTVNVTKQGSTSEESEDSDVSERDSTEKERKKTKILAEKVKVQVLKVITEQQRPGGLLYGSR